MLLSQETLALAGEARALRRKLHRIPETGLEETKTQRVVLDTLRVKGIDAQMIAGTGVRAVIAGCLPGPVTALRADMDALNIAEETGCGFESEHPGLMHACGHDGHMAALLCAAGLLVRNRERLRGTVVLLFQPCEEQVRGARQMISEGALNNPSVDRIFAVHLMPQLQQGALGVASGPVMAAALEFRMEIKGRSAHGAMPHMAVDAIAAAAQFVANAQAVVSRCKPPEEPGLLTFGKFSGGTRHNVIAGSVELEGTLRSYDDGLMARMKDRLLAHMRGTEEAWGVKASFEEISSVPVTVNDGGLALLARSVFPEACVDAGPLMVAEDFSLYCRQVPGFMGFLGCRSEEAGFTEPLHNPRFNFNEDALLTAVEFYKRLLID